MEKDIAQKTSEIGPDTNGKPAAGSATRQCWSQTQSKPNKSKTSFKAEYERKVNNHQDSLESNSSTFSWFVPDEQSQRPNTSSGLPAHNKSRGSQTNQSLFRQYYEKKDKARFINFKHFYQKLVKWPPRPWCPITKIILGTEKLIGTAKCFVRQLSAQALVSTQG